VARILKGEFTLGCAEDNLNYLKGKLCGTSPAEIKNFCYIKSIKLYDKDVRKS